MSDTNLLDYRVDRLEAIVEKLAENTEILIRIEANHAENSRVLNDIKGRVDYHGKTLDAWSRELESYKTTLNMHSWLFRSIGLLIAAALVTKFFSLW